MIESLCKRKMEISRMKPDERYLELMFEDEVRNFLFRNAVNEMSTQMMKEAKENVLNVRTVPMSSEMSECAGTTADEGMREVQGRNLRRGKIFRRLGRTSV